MANSKANIYPIQLQGAELNLNKYDAEIKQYSGFNKNNSPFVGGCLSNVFTKEVRKVGATDSNSYIDSDSNFYEVRVEGLKKNNINVIDFNNQVLSDNKHFVEKIHLIKNNNIVRYLTPNIYLRCVNNFWYLNNTSLDSYSGVLDTKTVAYHYCGITKYSDTEYLIVFCLKTRTPDYKIFYITVNTDGSNIHMNYRTVYCREEFDSKRFITPIVSENKIFFILYGVHDNDDIKYLAVSAELNNSYDISSFSSQSFSNIDYSNATEMQHLGSDPFDDWVLTNDGYLSLINPSYSYYSQTYSDDPRVQIAVRFKFSLTYTYSSTRDRLIFDSISNEAYINALRNSHYHVMTDEELCAEEVNNFLFNPGFLIGFVNFRMRFWKSYLTPRERVGNWIIGYNAKVNYYTSELVTDNEDNLIKRARNTCATAMPISKDNNFYLLVNNNQITGIATAGGILLTSWNNVTQESIVSLFEEEALCFEEAGEFYEIKLSLNKTLQKYNNQLVTNYTRLKDEIFDNNYKNCYFEDIGDNGVFAPSYNSAAYVLNSKVTMNLISIDRTSGEDIQDNKVWFAAAINEYNRTKNPSIILAPVHLNKLPSYTFSESTFANFANMFHDVNIYKGDDIDSLVYQYSIQNSSVFVKEELKGLPYPYNADGNVELTPDLFSVIKSFYGDKLYIKSGRTYYPLEIENNNPVMSFFLASGVDNFELGFIIQGQFYGLINNGIYSISYQNGVVGDISFVVDCTSLQFVGSTPYEALFFSKVNRCLYSFVGSNVLNQKQFVDKISEVRNYLYNPATQTVFLITDIGIIFYSLFGQFLLEYTDASKVYQLDNGLCISNNAGLYRYIKYYLDESDTDYSKHNIILETCFYGVNNETMTINDCLYFRLFSEEHEEGELKVSATTISLSGRKTENTTFKIKESDWDKVTHTIYLRYQPKEQRGLGVSFSIDSPFKIASLSVGSQPDSILIDKVSKGAINAPQQTSNNVEW
jgi:hypothetical protein